MQKLAKQLQSHTNIYSAMEIETIKNEVSPKNHKSKRNFLRKVCFALLAATLFVVCTTATIAQTQISIEEFGKQAQTIYSKMSESVKQEDYQTADKFCLEIIALFNCLSKENQEMYKQIQANIYYNRACYLSLQNQKEKAIEAFEKSAEYGWVNYAHAKADTDLDNIRSDERFIALLESIREKGDYVYILRQAGKYQSADAAGLPRFTYEAATSNNLKEVREFFRLDTVVGEGDEISKIINLLKWAHDNIRHDGNNYALCEFDAIDIYNYYKSTGKGVNCRHLAIALNEMYLAMGFKSRYITCLPKSEDDTECHVINSVYSNTLQKWLWIDPTNNAYVKDENGNLLSIEEVRERLIDDRTLVLNEDANWNNKTKKTKEEYLDSYMAKNMYWFQCPVNSCFNVESRYRYSSQTYISLRSLDDERSPYSENEVITHDAAYFWEH